MNSPMQHPNWRPRLGMGLSLALAVAASAMSGSVATGATSVNVPTGLGRLLADNDLTATTRGIATFAAVPTSGEVAALKGSG
jgi:hypothetical protein